VIDGAVKSVHLSPPAAAPDSGTRPALSSAPSLTAARKFGLTLDHVRAGGQAYGTGSFFDVPPTVTTFPERLSAAESNSKPVNHIFVTGLPNGLVDEQVWIGWLVPAGTGEWRDGNGEIHTSASYRVVLPPPPVDARTKPGGWMDQKGRTSLDQPARNSRFR